MQRPSLVTTTFVGYVASNASLALNNSEVKRGRVETYLQIGSCGRQISSTAVQCNSDVFCQAREYSIHVVYFDWWGGVTDPAAAFLYKVVA